MADAPKTESSSGWGAFEIGIVVLIVVALLSKGDLSNTSSSESTKNDTQKEEHTLYASGIQITSPAKNGTVGATFILRGIVEGGYWNPNPANGIVLSYQVIDSQGVPMSELKTLTKDPAVPHTAYVFEETVVLTATPKTKEGSLILIAPERGVDNQTISIRIPIRFEK